MNSTTDIRVGTIGADSDIDLALIFALDTDDPKHCESPGHNAYLGDGGHAGDNEVLWYAHVICGCADQIGIRCQAWLELIEDMKKLSRDMDMPGDYWCLLCEQEAITEVLERAN